MTGKLRIHILLAWALGAAAAAGQVTPAERAWSLADQGRDLARAGGTLPGLLLYERALDLAPEIVEIRRDYATALAWAERYEEASREFERVMEAAPEQPAWALDEIARAHYMAGAYEAAERIYGRMIAAGADEEAAWTRRGWSLVRLGRAAEAERLFRDALSRFPNSEGVVLGLAQSMVAQGRPEDARTLLVSWSASAPAGSTVRRFAARLAFDLGRHAEAIGAFEGVKPEFFHQQGLSGVAAEERWPGPKLEPPLRQPLTPEADTVTDYPAEAARALQQRGVAAARRDELEEALELLDGAVELQPDNLEIALDYGTVLGWAERYEEALVQFDRVFAKEPEQPVWARSEWARNQLFGDRPKAALANLDLLIAQGHGDLTILVRRGLALRWSGRSEEASELYRKLIEDYPDSPEGYRGLVQALSDRRRLADALDAVERGLEAFPDDEQLLLRRVQALNWSGFHGKARKVAAELPPELFESADGLHQRTVAAYWAGRPEEAFELARRYRRLHPQKKESAELMRLLAHENGAGGAVQHSGASDSTGYFYRSTRWGGTIPVTVGHRLGLFRERRNYEQRGFAPDAVAWRRHGLEWTGSLGRRVTASGMASTLRYDLAGPNRRFSGDLSAAAILTDHVTVAGGVGLHPAETLPALRERLMGGLLWGEARLRPNDKVRGAARYARRAFGEAAVRETYDLSAFRLLSRKGGHEVSLGGRAHWMRHDRYTPLFWSPQSFSTKLVSLHIEGSLASAFDYIVEAETGVQREHGFARQRPLVATMELARKLSPQLWLRGKAGYSNSAIDRLTTGAGGYQFRYFQIGLDLRLGVRGADEDGLAAEPAAAGAGSH